MFPGAFSVRLNGGCVSRTEMSASHFPGSQSRDTRLFTTHHSRTHAARGPRLPNSNAGGTESRRSELAFRTMAIDRQVPAECIRNSRPFHMLRPITFSVPTSGGVQLRRLPNVRHARLAAMPDGRSREITSHARQFGHAPDFFTHCSRSHAMFPAHRAGAHGAGARGAGARGAGARGAGAVCHVLNSVPPVNPLSNGDHASRAATPAGRNPTAPQRSIPLSRHRSTRAPE
jgi:hypothetical protein